MTTYTAPAGKPVAGGREIYPNAVLDLIDSTPTWGWLKLNTNRFEDAWPPTGLRPPYGGGKHKPDSIIRAWSSFAWDSNNSRMILWGGGHANTSGNDVYIWSAYTRQWSLAYHSTLPVQVGGVARYRSTDDTASPVSSHTYANNVYLPTTDRFLTMGGAAHGDGDSLRVWDGDTSLRWAGAFSLSLALEGKGYVGGEPGTNAADGDFAGVSLHGANAWTLHDWHDPDRPGGRFSDFSRNHINCGAVVRTENGKDVMYYTASSITSRGLWQTTFHDRNPLNDTQVRVSSGGSDSGSGQGPIAIDWVRDVCIKLRTGASSPYIQFVDMGLTWGTGNNWQSVTAFSGDTGDVSDFLAALTLDSGVVYDPVNECFLLWTTGRQVYQIIPPDVEPMTTTGWSIAKPTMDTVGSAPRDGKDSGDPNLNDTGTIGKWRWADDLGCPVALQNNFDGNVWVLKPAGWSDPRV